jgi:hypothetical protein
MKTLTKTMIAGAAALASVAMAGPALTQSSDIQNLLDGLMSSARSTYAPGWQVLRQPRASQLNNGGSQSFTLQLNPGREYTFIGVCDADCSDIDLRLTDARGNVLAEDVLVDDTPVLRYTARRAIPNARMTAVMAACSVDPCFYQVGSFGRAAR